MADEEELENIVDSIAKHTKANIDYFKLGMNIFELSQKGREIYEKKTLLEEKRELLNFVFSNFKIKDEKVVPVFQNGFQVVAARAETGDWLPKRNLNITTQLSHIIKVFEDFAFVNKLREELERVRPVIGLS